MDWMVDRGIYQSHCGTSVENTKILDHDFTYDVIFVESPEVPVMILAVLRGEAKPPGLKISWIKINI